MNILLTTTKKLPVKLTDIEVLAKGSELASTIQEVGSEEESQKNLKDQMKAKLSELAARQTRLAIIVATRTEYRDVEVQVEGTEDGQIREVRLDTGEIMLTRPPRDDERQFALSGMKKVEA